MRTRRATFGLVVGAAVGLGACGNATGGGGGTVMHLLWDPFDARWRGTIEVHDDVAPGFMGAATVSMRSRSCPR
jgi:hypothetical protein